MRTSKDRIRHTLGFESIGLIIFIPLASQFFGYELQEMSIMAVVVSIIATLWNYIYNLAFDNLMLTFLGNTRKSLTIRLPHAFLFELGLILILLPIITGYLNIGYKEAFIMNLGMATFYLVYAFIYNLCYDQVFPVFKPDYSKEATTVTVE